MADEIPLAPPGATAEPPPPPPQGASDTKTAPSLSEAVLRELSERSAPGGLIPVAGEAAFDVSRSIVSSMIRQAGSGVVAIPYLLSSVQDARDVIDFTMEGAYQPQTPVGEAGMRKLGELTELAAQGARFIGSGYRGIAELMFGAGVDNAAAGVREVQEQGIAGPLADRGYPRSATAAEVLPEVALGGTVARPGKTVANIGRIRNPIDDIEMNVFDNPELINLPEGYGGVGAERPGFREFEMADDAPVIEMGRLVQGRDAAGVAAAAEVDAGLAAAFQELGIEPSPAMVSRNPALQQIQSAQKAQVESGLQAIDEQVHARLVEASEELIERYSSSDRSAFDVEVKDNFNRTINDLSDEADKAYDTIRDNLDTSFIVDAGSSVEYVLKKASRLAGQGNPLEAGVRRLRGEDKALWDLLFRKTDDGYVANNVSYEAIDDFRRDVGAKMRATAFADQDQGRLKVIYSRLAEDQTTGLEIESPEMADLYTVATDLVRRRKGIEEAAISALGRAGPDGGTVLTKLDKSANDLRKGNTSTLEKLLEDLPEELRPAASAQVISNLFAPGSQVDFKVSQGFQRSWKSLSRNERAKDVLFENLPPEARDRFDIIAKAYDGFFGSKQFDNNSRTANAVIQAIRDGNFLTRLGGATYDVVLARQSQAVAQADRKGKKGNRRVRATDEFLQSQSLRDAINEYVSETGRGEALKRMQQDKSYKKWVKTLDTPERNEIRDSGFMIWLFADDMTERENDG